MLKRRHILMLLIAAVCLPTITGWTAAPHYAGTVKSLLDRHCIRCHGDKVRKADLDLSIPAGIRRGSESGPVIVPGKPEDSLLYEMIHGGRMPREGEPLAPVEQERIATWIKSGAVFAPDGETTAPRLNQHDIIPITLLRCNSCHGPQLQRGGLVMSTPTDMLKGGDNGPAIIPGDPDASPAIRRIESQLCPPKGQLLKYFVKRPTETEVAKLRAWIAAGAPQLDIRPDVAGAETDPLVTDEDRRHWSFQPLSRVAVPPPPPGSTNAIDAFIARRLNEAGLEFSPPATRAQLIRRAFLDLTGLPPAPAQLRRWLDADGDDWFGGLVDALLGSPHYGERWGRHWLDLAGYADSEGGVSADPVRKEAWKYRDYVINAFNRDKPYDQFLLEQLAGDELVDHANASEITAEMVDQLVATGFLRMGIDQTGSRTMNFVPERLGVIADAISVIGSAVMGLTLECARCHSHKYDPLPHRDYYRLQATLKGAFDEHDWLSFKNRTLRIATPEHRATYQSANPPVLKQIRKLEGELRRTEADLRLALLAAHHPDLSETDREDTLTALRKADNQRSLRQRTLVAKLQVAELIPDSAQPPAVLERREQLTRLNREIALQRRRLVPSLNLRALWDRGRPSPTYILRRGEHDKPGRLVGPGVPSVLTDGRTPFKVEPPFPGGTPKTGRRLAFARWLTQPDHPLTARVLVNRVWFHHFGTGLVRSLENFGLKGDRPSHPELLDWLAGEFVRGGWSIKQLHRLIMTSRTYRQSSRIGEHQLARDPQNRLVSRMPLRRMDAETVRDSLLFVAGRLDPRPGGPPDSVSVDREGLVSVDPTDTGNWRRSVYAQYRRTEIPTMMNTFDYPVMGPNCVERSRSIISPQSLMLLNNRRVRELSGSLADRVLRRQPDGTPEQLVDEVHTLALSRPPQPEELAVGRKALVEMLRTGTARPAALQTYCHAILNSAAFIYVD